MTVLGATVLAMAGPASAHTPSVTPSCTGLSVNLTNYETPDINNLVVVTVDGTVAASTTFGDSYSADLLWSDTSNHTWKVDIDANRTKDTTEKSTYDKVFEGTQTACTQVITIEKVWNVNAATNGGYTADVTAKTQATHASTFVSLWASGPGTTSSTGLIDLGASFTIDEKGAVVPSGCTLTGSTGTGTFTSTAAVTTYTVTNNVDCSPPPVEVTVRKVWVVDGNNVPATIPATITIAAPLQQAAGSAVLSNLPVVFPVVSSSTSSTVVTVASGSSLAISETAALPAGCQKWESSLDPNGTLELKHLTASTTVTVTNTVTCNQLKVPVEIRKEWHGSSAASATTVVNVVVGETTVATFASTNPTAASTIVELSPGQSFTITETNPISASLPGYNCSVERTSGLGTFTVPNARGGEPFIVVNTVSCTPTPPPTPPPTAGPLPIVPVADVAIVKTVNATVSAANLASEAPLPATGGSLRLAGLAMVLVGLGSLALIFGRRRDLMV